MGYFELTEEGGIKCVAKKTKADMIYDDGRFFAMYSGGNGRMRVLRRCEELAALGLAEREEHKYIDVLFGVLFKFKDGSKLCVTDDDFRVEKDLDDLLEEKLKRKEVL